MELTISDIRELLGGKCATSSHSFETGENYFVRTVTYHHVGRLVAVTDSDLVLEDASWVADSGRFGEAIASGQLSEIERFASDVIISRGAVVDATRWAHDLPRESK